jgi:hypothetical protein
MPDTFVAVVIVLGVLLAIYAFGRPGRAGRRRRPPPTDEYEQAIQLRTEILPFGLRSHYEYHPEVLNRERGRRSGPRGIKRRGELDASLDDPPERQ